MPRKTIVASVVVVCLLAVVSAFGASGDKANSPWRNCRKFVGDDEFGGSERMLRAALL
jgi:hypothetical protein